MKTKKKTIWVVLIIVLVLVVAWMGISMVTNPHNLRKSQTVGEIAPPRGFERVDARAGDYTSFLRSLPLKPYGTKVQLYTGGDARLQFLSAAVIDLPLLSNYEQCADATMRIRAEYFYKSGRYGDIRFTDVNGNKLTYQGGANRKAFEKYMRIVYGVCSTFSLFHETKPRAISEVQPGDVLVFKAREGRKYGHAILVADVARNKQGKVAILCLEGNTPARDLHIMRNMANPARNPWFILDEDDSIIMISVFPFHANELRHY